jgi:hypothetical protein
MLLRVTRERVPEPSSRAWPAVPVEVVIVMGAVVFVVLVSLPGVLGLQVGAALVAFSLTIGVFAGIGYHVVLGRALPHRPARWWWNPTAHHGALAPEGRRRVMPWFVVGAAGFGGSMLGCATFLSAALRL